MTTLKRLNPLNCPCMLYISQDVLIKQPLGGCKRVFNHKLHRFFLILLAYWTINVSILIRSNTLHIYSANIGDYMPYISAPLPDQLTIYFFQIVVALPGT